MRPELPRFGSSVEWFATCASFSRRLGDRLAIGALVTSTLAGCNAVANLSEFDNAHVGASDAAADAGGSTNGPDAGAVDAARQDGAPQDDAQASEAGLDATLGDATVSPEAGGLDATFAEDGGDAAIAPEIDAGEDAETEASCVCSGYGASSTTCGAPCAPVCGSYFGNCNASSSPNPDDGCETYLDSLTSCRSGCGTTAVACNATDVCNAGVCGAAHGLVVFTVPLSATGQIQRYADRPAVPWNLEGKTMFVRMYAPGATGGIVLVYLSDNSANSNQGPSITVNLSQLANGWTDVELTNITDEPAPFSAEQVKQVTLEVRAGSDTAWTNPTVVYVDSVRASDVTIDDTFDTSIGNMVASTQATVPGSTLTWQDSVTPLVDGGELDAATSDAGDAATDAN